MTLQGTITALVTPFSNNQIDEEKLVNHIHDQLYAGVNGILLLGITGECCTITPEEQTKIIQIGVREVKGRVPLIIGTDSSSTQTAIEKTQKAKELGADVALVVTPYFNKPTQEGIFRHFEAIVKSVDLPVIVYNHPGRAVVNIELTTMLRIVDLPHIIGIKDAAEHLSQASDLIYALKDKKPQVSIFSADDASTYPLMALGASGVISVVSNLLPLKVIHMVNALLEGRFKEALELHYELLPLCKALFVETNPIPIKTAMNLCNKSMGELRLPLCEMRTDHLDMLKRVLGQLNLLPQAHKESVIEL